MRRLGIRGVSRGRARRRTRSGRGGPAGPGAPGLHRTGTQPAVGRRLHLRTDQHRHGVRRVHRRLLLPVHATHPPGMRCPHRWTAARSGTPATARPVVLSSPQQRDRRAGVSAAAGAIRTDAGASAGERVRLFDVDIRRAGHRGRGPRPAGGGHRILGGRDVPGPQRHRREPGDPLGRRLSCCSGLGP